MDIQQQQQQQQQQLKNKKKQKETKETKETIKITTHTKIENTNKSTIIHWSSYIYVLILMMNENNPSDLVSVAFFIASTLWFASMVRKRSKTKKLTEFYESEDRLGTKGERAIIPHRRYFDTFYKCLQVSSYLFIYL